MSTPPRFFSAWTLLAAAAYLALAVALTWPLAADAGQIRGSVIAGADGWQKVYFFWWARYAVEARTSPLFADLLYAPRGARMELEPLMLPLSVATLPIQYAFGPVVAYNAATLATLAMNGLALYALALRLVRHRAGAIVAGALWVASPIALTVIWHGQLEKAIWWTAPLLMLLLLALYGPPRSATTPARAGGWGAQGPRSDEAALGRRGAPWRKLLLAAAAAALLALTALLGLYVFLFTCVFCTLLTLGAAARRPRPLAVLGWGALVAGLAAIPVLLLTAGALRAGGGPGEDRIWIDISRTQGADLLDLWLPFASQPARRDVWQFTDWPHTGSWQSAAGWTALALAGVGLLRARRQALPLLALAAAMGLVGMGASLRVAGVDTGVPLPYRLIEGLPGVSASRYPQLALFCTHMLIALAAGVGVRELRLPTRLAGTTFAALLCAAALVEYGGWQTAPRPIPIPPAVERLAALPPAGSVVGLPYNHDIADQLVYQTVHRRPIWGGYLARIPPDYTEVQFVPILRELRRLAPDRPDIVRYDADDRRTLLRFYGASHVLFDRARAEPGAYERFRAIWRRVDEAPPILADPAAEVYAIPEPAVARPQIYIRQGWWEPEEGARWLSEAGTLRLVNPGPAARATLRMTIAEAPVNELMVEGLGERRVLPVAPGVVELALDLPPGEHELRVSARGVPQPGRPGRLVSVRVTLLELARETR